MTYSSSGQPDLDWSQVRETIKLLAISVVQVERSMKIGDESVNVLTDAFACMVEDMNAIHKTLDGMQPIADRDIALARCKSTQDKINASIVAFQFYDRLQQCMHHVSSGLRGLSTIIDDPQRLYNPAEWHKFQSEIRSHYTMESEKVMFDLILQGKSIDEALVLAESDDIVKSGEDIEWF